jgi:hypothetical protein
MSSQLFRPAVEAVVQSGRIRLNDLCYFHHLTKADVTFLAPPHKSIHHLSLSLVKQ